MTLQQELQLQADLTAAYHRYMRDLRARAFYKVHDRDMSEDLVQDTFLKTWSYLLKGEKVAMMKSFLYHVLNNLIVDAYRKQKTMSLDVLLEKGYEPSDTQPERLIDILDGKAACRSLRQLPRKYGKVMHLRYAKGLSLGEISLRLGQSKNTTSVQMHRGLEKMRSSYRQLQPS